MNDLLQRALNGEDIKSIVEAPTPQSTPILVDKFTVLYDPPTPGRAFRNCLNCSMWITTKQCMIHKKDQEVLSEDICGLYVYGSPMDKYVTHAGTRPYLPEHSGLENVPGGTACINCSRYTGSKTGKAGICQIMKPTDNKVDSMGCCTGWEPIPVEDNE